MQLDKQKDTVNIYVVYAQCPHSSVVTNLVISHVLHSRDNDTPFLAQINGLLYSRNGTSNILTAKLHSSGNFHKKNPGVRMQICQKQCLFLGTAKIGHSMVFLVRV